MKQFDKLEMNIENYKVKVMMPKTKDILPLVYVHTLSEEESNKIWEALLGECILICIEIKNWNCDLSPWKAEKAFKQGENFEGGADQYLDILTKRIVLEVEKMISYEVKPEQRCIAGYSMAGLFAIYAMYHTNLFEKIVSASGSLWFDHFLSYAQEEEILVDNPKIYLSIGDKEENTKNSRMCTVIECTKVLYKFYYDKGFETIYEVNKGGHFQNPMKRLCDGIKWSINKI